MDKLLLTIVVVLCFVAGGVASPMMHCLFGDFWCDYRKTCISSIGICNGIDDCGDSSDEQRCGLTVKNGCSSHHFMCDNGNCIPPSYKCDGDDDCRDSSDERNCSSTLMNGCSPHQFTCDNGNCIRSSYKCDGDNDCGDLSDERSCTTWHHHTQP